MRDHVNDIHFFNYHRDMFGYRITETVLGEKKLRSKRDVHNG